MLLQFSTQVEATTTCCLALRTAAAADEALRDCNAALELKPDTPAWRVNRGLVYSNARQFDLAIKDYDEALRVKPGYVDAYLAARLGLCGRRPL